MGCWSMAEGSHRNRGSHHNSSGLLNNYRYLCRKNMVLHATEKSKGSKKHQWNSSTKGLKRKPTESLSEKLHTKNPIKKKPVYSRQDSQINFETLAVERTEEKLVTPALAKAAGRQGLSSTLGDIWEVDSGFSSETSPPASGRSSPSLCPWQATVVSLDCEMVGTGPGGQCSELARCSVLDYHGNILYDKYIRPCQRVTDYRTRWSGIQRHHLLNAFPYSEAREEIIGILKGKVVVGHSVCNDFMALDMNHPGHMVRDISSTRLLRQMAGFPSNRCVSLKILADKLLNRRIQTGRRGHCSVEDALAALDLYKLVEEEWEQELQEMLGDRAPASTDHYMQDEYWPVHLTEGSQ